MNPINVRAKSSIALCGPDFLSGTIGLSTACNRVSLAIYQVLPLVLPCQ